MDTGFCAKCGAPKQGAAGFCTKCGAQHSTSKKPELWHILTAVAAIAVVAFVIAVIAFSGRGGGDGSNSLGGGRNAPPDRSGQQSGEPAAAGPAGTDAHLPGAGQPTDGQAGTGGQGSGNNSGGNTVNTGGSTGDATNTAPHTLDELLDNGSAVQYRRGACYDPALGCEAVRSAAPSDWNTGGQAYWTMQSGAAPATVDFYIESPDDTARAGWVSGVSYVQLDQSYQLADGQWHSGSVAPVRAFQDAQTYAQSFFIEYTGVTDIQLIDVEYPDDAMRRSMEQFIANQYAETNAMLEQMAPMAAAQNVVYSFDHYADAAQVTLRFEVNGVPCRAKAFVLISATLMSSIQELAYVGQVSEQQLHWNTKLGFYYYMAQEHVFNVHEAAAGMFFANLVVNEQWSGAVRLVSEEMFSRQLEATFEQVQQSQQAMQQYGAQAVAQSSQNYYQSAIDNRSDAIHSAMDGWTNVVRGQDYFAGADGAPVLLDNSYSHTYTDGAGNFVQSNDSWDTPYGWNEVSGSSMWP